MGGWNTDSGASLHSELIGRSFVNMGHDLTVFTFYEHAFHGTQITGENEPYVTRCFTHSRFNPVQLNPIPFITQDYELFIAEDIGMLPKDDLKKIYDTYIKKRAKTINVIHDNALSDDPSFYQFEWDAIVCFDERYKPFLKEVNPESKIRVIPYPCLPWNKGDKYKAREKLDLPKDKKIILTFGPNSNRLLDVINEIDCLNDEYPVLLLVLSKDPVIINTYKKLKKKMKSKVVIREESPSIHRLYRYLHASDILLYYRQLTPHIVVASTIMQCLGAGCPIVANVSRFTETFNNEIFKFNNQKELLSGIKHIFDETDVYNQVMASAKDYVTRCSQDAVAKKFIELYKTL